MDHAAVLYLMDREGRAFDGRDRVFGGHERYVDKIKRLLTE